MGFRNTLLTWLFGYNPAERQQQMQAVLDTISSEVADLKILTQAIAEITPPQEWSEGMTQALVNMDRALKNFKMTLESHQECIQHIMTEHDPNVTVTDWGMIRNEKDSN